MKIISIFLILSMLMSPVQSLIVPIVVKSNKDKQIQMQIEAQEELERQKQAELEAQRLAEEAKKNNKVTLNNTLDLDGYCNIKIPSEYFDVLDESSFTRKVLRYKDKKTKVIMSYVTGIEEGTDIPGYIVREAADLDIVTNSKYNEELETGTWTIVPSEKPIDNNYPTVYYLLSEDETSAFWVRTNVYEESLGEEFDGIIREILNSIITYYGHGTVFNTPETGYYQDGEVDGAETIANTEEYNENTDENTVFDTGNYGYDLSAEIGLKWSDLEILVDGTKIKVPCTLQDMNEAGFKINDSKVISEDGTYPIGPSGNDKIDFIKDGVTITSTFKNESNTDMMDIAECTITKIEINTTTFITKSEEEVDAAEEYIEQSLEEDIDADTERLPERLKVFDSVGGHNVVLPGKIMINIYVQDLLDQYGDPNQTIRQKNMNVFTWDDKDAGKQLVIGCGLVKNIQYISMSSMGDSIEI